MMKTNRATAVLASILLFAMTGCSLELTAPREIRFHSNDGGDVVETQKTRTGQAVVLKANAFFRGEGYEFRGWMATAVDGTQLDFEDGQEIVMGSDSLDLYALWDDGLLHGGTLVGSAGGAPFYDKRYYSDGWRYMEAAPVSTEWTAEWGATGYVIWPDGDELPPGRASLAMDASFGGGMGNTAGTVEFHDRLVILYPARGDYYTHPAAYPTGFSTDSGPVLGDGSVAAKLCADLVYGYCDDWFLPSQAELSIMYSQFRNNRDAAFSTSRYWCSNEVNVAQAYAFDFSTGKSEYDNLKFENLKVRAIRVF